MDFKEMDFKALEHKPQRMEHYFKASHRVQTQGRGTNLFCILSSDDGLECCCGLFSHVHFPAIPSCLTAFLIRNDFSVYVTDLLGKGASSS